MGRAAAGPALPAAARPAPAATAAAAERPGEGAPQAGSREQERQRAAAEELLLQLQKLQAVVQREEELLVSGWLACARLAWPRLETLHTLSWHSCLGCCLRCHTWEHPACPPAFGCLICCCRWPFWRCHPAQARVQSGVVSLPDGGSKLAAALAQRKEALRQKRDAAEGRVLTYREADSGSVQVRLLLLLCMGRC